MKKIFAMLVLLSGIITACDNTPEIKTFEVTFETNGGTEIEMISYDEGETFDLPDNPTKEDSVFDGWYVDEDFSTTYSSKDLPDNITLYAKWIDQFELSLFDDEGDLISKTLYDIGETVQLDVLEKEGFEFTGWFNRKSELVDNSFIMPAESISLYATYKNTELTFPIALITDGGGVDDGSIMQAVWEGIVGFALDNEVNVMYFQPLDREFDSLLDCVELAVLAGAEIIVLPGFIFENTAFIGGILYPEVDFILLDGSPHNVIEWNSMSTYNGEEMSFEIGDNVLPILFAEEQAGYLAGYAAVIEGFRNLGFMGGIAVPAVVKYGYGFLEGANQAAIDLGLDQGSVDVKFEYSGTFSASNQVEALATLWYQEGTEVIFTVQGGANGSVFRAAQFEGRYTIGVDFDQSYMSSSVITSAVKDFGSVIYIKLNEIYGNDNTFGEIYRADIESSGLMLPMETSRFNNFDQTQYDNLLLNVPSSLLVYFDPSEEISAFITRLDRLVLID
jgi:basic membrane protein A